MEERLKYLFDVHLYDCAGHTARETHNSNKHHENLVWQIRILYIYIYITILNKKIRSILLAHNQPKRINAHVYMV